MNLQGYCKRRLKAGMTINDYKSLCKELNEPVLKGEKKEEQLKNFEDYFKYRKEGRKFYIEEVYSRSLTQQKKSENYNKYSKRVQAILLSFLSRNKQEVTYLTKNQLILLLGLVNQYYIDTYSNRNSLLSLDSEMELFPINNFFERSDKKNRDIIRRAFGTLEGNNLINVSITYLIKGCDMWGDSSREATEEDIKYIMDIKHNLLKKYQIESEKELFFGPKKRRENFYEELSSIFKADRNWEYVIKVYKFIYNYKNVIDKININELSREVNTLVQEALDKQADKNYRNHPFTEEGLEINEFMYNENYSRLQKILSEKLIKLPEEGES